MSRFIIVGLTLLLSASLIGHSARATVAPSKKAQPPSTQLQPVKENEESIVKNLVADFGKKLQKVSLSSDPVRVSKSIRENYAAFLSPALLGKWQKDPGQALGRSVSSPWPDRIDILSIQKTAVSTYKVSGFVVEITSTEKVNGGIAAKRPVVFSVKKINNHWFIDGAIAGSYEVVQSVNYQNTQYGFNFLLPNDWRGYTILTDKWDGLAIGDSQVLETGPLVSIRHPGWTQNNPRQDIPIMIFTLAQWDLLQQDKFHIGAAPIGPSEIGRNSHYVFALPARYNFAFPTGYEEVEQILKGKPLQPLEIFTDGLNVETRSKL